MADNNTSYMGNQDTSTTGYWVTAIILVVAVVFGIWYFTAQNESPLIPNTGVDMTVPVDTNPVDTSVTN